jgi:hypothetical protein
VRLRLASQLHRYLADLYSGGKLRDEGVGMVNAMPALEAGMVTCLDYVPGAD